jgi:hypothetical protein
MLTLGTVPNTTEEQFLDYVDNQIFIQWPARDGDRHVIVKINTRELSDYNGSTGGSTFWINSAETKKALELHREFIQTQVRSKYRQGDKVVTLDVGDMTGRKNTL